MSRYIESERTIVGSGAEKDHGMRKKARSMVSGEVVKHGRGTDRRFWTGLAIVGFFIIFGFGISFLAPADPTVWNHYPTDLGVSGQHLLGTTDLGQDTFFLLAISVRNSMIIGLLVASLATAIGVMVGLWAGFFGGLIDRLLTLVTDAVIVIPSLPILILISAMLQGKASLVLISLVLTAFNWPWPARQARALALTLREREFVNTALFSGESTPKILLLEVAPYVRTWAVGNFVNTVLVAIGAEAGLAIIGLSSMQRATLGTMIYWAMQHEALLRGFWIWIGSPVVSIVVLFLGLILVSAGIATSSKRIRGIR